jgi:ketosteroid isomerase-like protein
MKATTPSEEESTMGIQHNKDVVQRFDALSSGGDLSQLEELCTSDMVNHALAPGLPGGIEGTREFLTSARRGQKTGRWVHSVVVAEGDFVVQFGVLTGDWNGGSFRGFNMPRGSYTRDVAFMYRLVDGRIAERWAVRDDLGLMLQLGALTPE